MQFIELKLIKPSSDPRRARVKAHRWHRAAQRALFAADPGGPSAPTQASDGGLLERVCPHTAVCTTTVMNH